MTPKKTPKAKKPVKKAPAKKAPAKKPVTLAIPKKEDLPIPSKGEKTAREWFAELPDGVREAAIRNTRKFGGLDCAWVDMSRAIMGSFTRGPTPEGFGYWDAMHSLYFEIEREQEKREAEEKPAHDPIDARIRALEWLYDGLVSRVQDLELRLAIKEDDIEKPKRKGFWAWLGF